ncbi:glutaredoxin-C6-like [Magnolia sinica]|uniref:glutaredoxin-C6-like n=1 Tax=Magnolia sinica TaxID=86752 RepID=UPI00265AFE8A|nr:glutaredoxin-C6-like [Magnolia sinica]
MQGMWSDALTDGGGLELTTPTNAPLSIDVAETPEKRIQRLISENPAIIFSRPSCCMCHVMRQLLASLGVHPTVIELDDGEMDDARQALRAHGSVSGDGAPAIFIGGAYVGGLDSLMKLHLSGGLVPKLKEVGAAWL